MFRSGIRNLLARLAKDFDAKADSSFGGLAYASAEDDSARDEFITAYIIAREPMAASRTSRLTRLRSSSPAPQG